MFHKRGALGAARTGDDVNPSRASSGSPHLDQQYTVFGEVVKGMEVVDSIAAVKTSGPPLDRPLTDVRILKMRLIPRKTGLIK